MVAVNEVVIAEDSGIEVDVDEGDNFGEKVKDMRFGALDMLLETAAERDEMAAADTLLEDELAAAGVDVVLDEDNSLL